MSEKNCLICQTAGDKTLAKFYCKTCDPARPLCEKCAQQHAKHLKGHQILKEDEVLRTSKISFDIEKPDISMDNADVDQLCFLCLRISEKTKATSICNTCDDFKPMCDHCAYQHTRQKMTRDHTILEISEKSFNNSNKDMQTVSVENEQEDYEHEDEDDEFEEEEDEDEEEGDEDQKEGEDSGNKDRKGHIKDKVGNEEDEEDENEEYTSNEKFQISVPGEPILVNNEDDDDAEFLKLRWAKPDDNFDYFLIRYRRAEDDLWEEIDTQFTDNIAIISNLRPDTSYHFQVKGIFKGNEGGYSPESDPILTHPSLAQKMRAYCTQISTERNPTVFHLQGKVIPGTEDSTLKVRKILLGGNYTSKATTHERTILILGNDKCGKTTMIDAFINYILGVTFEDNLRFTLNTETEKVKDEWLTVYKMQHFDRSKIRSTLNIIDTPGFGDNIFLNQKIQDQLNFLFSANGKQGVKYLDAICIILKENDLLDPEKFEQSLQNMLSHIGKNLEANVCILKTFSAVNSFSTSEELAEKRFPVLGNFDNSVLFDCKLPEQTHLEMLSRWDMGWESFERFFNHFESLTRKSVDETLTIISERKKIESQLSEMKQDIASVFSVIYELEEKSKIRNRQKEVLDLCREFEYEKKQSKIERSEMAKGHHSVYCPLCLKTCNADCSCTENGMARCSSIGSSEDCQVCDDNCPLAFHAKLDFNLKHVEETITETNEKLKNVFQHFSDLNKKIEQEITDLSNKIDEQHKKMIDLMKTIAISKNKSDFNSLYPYPKPIDWPIVQMIEAEETLKHEGFQTRIKAAKELQEKLKKFCSLKHVLI